MSYLCAYISIGVVVYIMIKIFDFYRRRNFLIKDILLEEITSIILLWPIVVKIIIEVVFEEKALIKGRKKKEKR